MKTVKQKLIALGLSSFIATAGLFVAKHEGLVLGTYLDPIGILTSCYGHTGKELKISQKFNEEQCLEQLAKDLASHDRELMRNVLVPLSEEEHAAYLSFTYNVGVGSFSKSTLLKKLNSSDHIGACKELPRWVYAGGKKLNGLVRRREAEKELCLLGAMKTEDK